MSLSDSSSRYIGWKNWLLTIWSFIEVLLFGGLLFGWGSLVFVLKDEGIYANLCQQAEVFVNETSNTTLLNEDVPDLNSSTDATWTSIITSMTIHTKITESTVKKVTDGDSKVCKPQENKMELCFAIASALLCFSSVIIGQINYTFGTRATRIVAFVSFTVGALLMAFVSVDVPWLIYPGLTMIGVGGLPLVVTDVQVSNLFTKGRATIAAGLNAALDMSSGMQLVVKHLHESGYSRQNMYLVITGLHSLTLVSTFGLLPKKFIPVSEDSEILKITMETEPEGKETKTRTGKSAKVSVSTVDSMAIKLETGKISSISPLNCIKQPLFITHCVWFCVLQLKFFYFMGSLNTYLNRMLDDNSEEVSIYTNVGFFIVMGGLLSSFLAGNIYDWLRKRYQEGLTQLYRDVGPAVIPLAVGSLLSMLFSVLTLIPSSAVIYPVFICMTLSRSFLYGINASFLSVVFPIEYFGFLFGILQCIGGVVSFLQYAFFTWAESYIEAPLHADIVLLILVSITFVHPAYIWLKCTREERKYHEKHQMHS